VRANLRRCVRDGRGFTLVELLVVMLIIAILTAIALPTFLGQQSKAQDASAKSDARNMVSQVESCYAVNEDYTQCSTNAALSPTGLNWGTGAGQVAVLATFSNAYTVGATSQSGDAFYIVKASGLGTWRVCWPLGKGACPRSGLW
jgi:type IV pilus assembly protein PilA